MIIEVNKKVEDLTTLIIWSELDFFKKYANWIPEEYQSIGATNPDRYLMVSFSLEENKTGNVLKLVQCVTEIPLSGGNVLNVHLIYRYIPDLSIQRKVQNLILPSIDLNNFHYIGQAGTLLYKSNFKVEPPTSTHDRMTALKKVKEMENGII